MSGIFTTLQAVQARIAEAVHTAGRNPAAVRLLAVSKTWPAAAVAEAVQAGQRAFGENYVQEGVEKIHTLLALHEKLVSTEGAGLEWHFIGPLQSNKTRLVAENFAWVHSVDRLKVAERLSAQRPAHLAPLQVCVQVNVSAEDSKSGTSLDEAAALARAVASLPGIVLRGLMTIPEPTEDISLQRQGFARLRLLWEGLRAEGLALDTLSMGMSHDLEAAILEGATMVRVGTAIFGARQYV